MSHNGANDIGVRKPTAGWAQFSLRGLLGFVFLTTLPCAWLHQLQARRAAIDELRALGARVSFEWQLGDSEFAPPPHGPKALRALFGEDAFAYPLEVQIYPNRGLPNVGLEYLGALWGTERLRLYNANVTDAGLMHLEELTSLRVLALDGTGISDDGLRHVKNLRNLEELTLIDTQVSDAGLRHLGWLKGLKLLAVTRTRTTRAGVAELKRHLPGCNIIR